jgi:FkbM family methyltransferase
LKILPKDVIEGLNNKDFLDCGAFVGDSALVFEKYYNPKKIHSFEPDRENFNYLLETIELNDLRKVIPIKMGVGSKDEQANFFHMAGASHITDNENDPTIEIIPIDMYVDENGLDVGLIKMDVEGFELEALEGAKEAIKKFKPVLCLAIYHSAAQFIDAIRFVQDLNLGYHINIRHLSDFIPINETALIAW